MMQMLPTNSFAPYYVHANHKITWQAPFQIIHICYDDPLRRSKTDCQCQLKKYRCFLKNDSARYWAIRYAVAPRIVGGEPPHDPIERRSAPVLLASWRLAKHRVPDCSPARQHKTAPAFQLLAPLLGRGTVAKYAPRRRNFGTQHPLAALGMLRRLLLRKRIKMWGS